MIILYFIVEFIDLEVFLVNNCYLIVSYVSSYLEYICIFVIILKG